MINYDKLMQHKPTVYNTITNKKRQKIDLVEHPKHGDMAPVILIFHAEKKADYSDFFDTEDLETDDYMPYYQDGGFHYGDY